MPARQRGTVVRRPGRKWEARWRDESDRPRLRGGFETKTAARDWLEAKVERVAAVRNAARFGDPLPGETGGSVTVAELIEGFLAQHEVDPATIRKLRSQLGHAVGAFGDRPIVTLTPMELAAWRGGLPARSRHYIFRAFRQVLEQAVAWEMLERNPTGRIRNKRAVVDEERRQRPFETWEQVEAIAAELDARYRAIPIVLVGTGLRPEELFALERSDYDRAEAVLHVRRVYSQRLVKECKKSDRQRRRVPLRQRVVDAIEAMPRRIDTRLLFPAPKGGHIDLERFRYREWTPALKAADVDHRRIYDTRHTFATWAIAGGVQLFYLARTMGTSVAQIDATYGHLLPESEDYLRGLFDAYDERAAAAADAN